MRYAAINTSWQSYVVGDTRAEIIEQICAIRIEGQTAYWQVKHFNEQNRSYSDEFTKEEIYKDLVDWLFNRLQDYRWDAFINKANVAKTW